MADPFDFSATDPNTPGMLGQPVSFWQNLARFGGNLAAGANARTPQGFLANGPGLAGPLGAAIGTTMEQGQKAALGRSALAHQGQETRKLGLENRLTEMGMPFQEALTRARMGALGDIGAFPAAGTVAPQASNAGDAAMPPEYAPFYQEASARTGIPIPVLVAQARQESGFNPNATGQAGEIGLHQILPSTAQKPGFGMVGVDPASLRDPRTNINFAADYLKARGGPRTNFADPATVDAALKNYNGGGDPNYVANVRRYMTGAPSQAAGPVPTPVASKTGPGNYAPSYQPPGAPAPYQVAQAGSAPLPMPGPRAAPQPAPQQGAAPAPGTPDAVALAQRLRQEGAALTQQANRAALIGGGIGGDPALIRQSAMEKIKLADQLETAGPMETAKGKAGAPFKLEQARPGSIIFDANGRVVGSSPHESTETVLEGPNKGMPFTVLRSPVDNSLIGGNGSAGPNGLPPGAIPKGLPPAETGRMAAAGQVEGHDIEHDRKIVETDLAHVVDNTIQGKLQMLKLRTLIDPAATGFMGETRMAVKNAIETMSPTFASAFDIHASPAQELKKIATMGAGKSEREDQGAKGGLRLMQIYMEANPNLENQPDANKHMANMILMAHQLHEDYALGANSFYQKNREGFVGPEHKTYQPISQYDQTFIQKMRPELYKAATDALNGKPYAEWSKGVTGPQLQIVGGILQRADPNASIDLGGKLVPVTAFTKTIGPHQITEEDKPKVAPGGR